VPTAAALDDLKESLDKLLKSMGRKTCTLACKECRRTTEEIRSKVSRNAYMKPASSSQKDEESFKNAHKEYNTKLAELKDIVCEVALPEYKRCACKRLCGVARALTCLCLPVCSLLKNQSWGRRTWQRLRRWHSKRLASLRARRSAA
jgi:hypothetical protein